MRRALVKTLQSMEQKTLRKTSRNQVLRGLKDFQKFGDILGREALPATELSAANYLVYSVTCRQPDTLDSSSVINYAAGQSLWHSMVREQTGLPLVNPYRTKRVRRPSTCACDPISLGESPPATLNNTIRRDLVEFRLSTVH